MISHECAAVVSLPMDIKGGQCYLKCPNEGTILFFQTLFVFGIDGCYLLVLCWYVDLFYQETHQLTIWQIFTFLSVIAVAIAIIVGSVVRVVLELLSAKYASVCLKHLTSSSSLSFSSNRTLPLFLASANSVKACLSVDCGEAKRAISTSKAWHSSSNKVNNRKKIPRVMWRPGRQT